MTDDPSGERARGASSPAHMPALSTAHDAAAPLPGPLISLEEAAVRLMMTRHGAYALLTRKKLPYVCVLSQWTKGRLRRRIAVTPRTLRAMMQARLATARRRGRWSAADYTDLGLEPPAGEAAAGAAPAPEGGGGPA